MPGLPRAARRGDRNVTATAPRQPRVARRPRHTFYVQTEAFELNPFMIAPVFANETLVEARFQSRKVSDAMTNALAGAWNEYFLFYVPMRAVIDNGGFSEAGLIDPDANTSAYNRGTTSNLVYTLSGAVDFVQQCLEIVTENYFRDGTEAWDAYEIRTGLPAVAVNQEGWWTTLIDKDSVIDPSDVTLLDAATTDTLEVSEVAAALQNWRADLRFDLTKMDFEDWLAGQGVRRPRLDRDSRVPEVLRYWRDYGYPTNTVGEDGTVNTQHSWSSRFMVNRRKYFAEPGFIFGCTCMRPKVFYSNILSAGVTGMNNTFRWTRGIPDLISGGERQMGYTSAGQLQTAASVEEVFHGESLFTLGDQFVNVDMGTDTYINAIALPTADMSNVRYPTPTMARSVFADTVTPNIYAREDGIVELEILGHPTMYPWR